MKAIVSHDVDHITVLEHHKDLIIPKLLMRQGIELLTGKVSLREYAALFPELVSNKWQYLREVMLFDREHGIPSTFFVAVDNALGLSYDLKPAAHWVTQILANGFDVGVHGICFDSLPGIGREYELFRSISGLETFGIRTHYLRMAAETQSLFDRVGYSFDTSISAVKPPTLVGDMWEFPLHVMDVDMFQDGQKPFTVSLEQAQQHTIRVIDQVVQNDLPYLTFLFHDRYFSPPFSKWSEWYRWLVDYLQQQGVAFVSYRQAIDELRASGAFE